MEEVILFRIGWMREYRGLTNDSLDGGGRYPRERGYGGVVHNSKGNSPTFTSFSFLAFDIFFTLRSIFDATLRELNFSSNTRVSGPLPLRYFEPSFPPT